jgi:Ca-activated chloride channel family protein
MLPLNKHALRWALSTAFLAALPLLQAQAQQAAPQDEVPLFTADTRLVVVHASVLDRNGKLVTNLAEPAFKVQENGVDQVIKLFRREDLPVSMGIIIDSSVIPASTQLFLASMTSAVVQ